MAQMTVTPVSTQGFLVNGKWIEEGDVVEIHAPFDGSVLAQVYQGRREHAEAAIAAAVRAFGTTRRLPAFERQPSAQSRWKLQAGKGQRKQTSAFLQNIALSFTN